jgi:hypothetical protein
VEGGVMSDEVEDAGDFAVVLSSELIAKVMQEYFVKVMFKQKVRIVDLKPASDGYMFSVSFVKKEEDIPLVTTKQYTTEEFDQDLGRLIQKQVTRASNGKFTKKEKV